MPWSQGSWPCKCSYRVSLSQEKSTCIELIIFEPHSPSLITTDFQDCSLEQLFCLCSASWNSHITSDCPTNTSPGTSPPATHLLDQRNHWTYRQHNKPLGLPCQWFQHVPTKRDLPTTSQAANCSSWKPSPWRHFINGLFGVSKLQSVLNSRGHNRPQLGTWPHIVHDAGSSCSLLRHLDLEVSNYSNHLIKMGWDPLDRRWFELPKSLSYHKLNI